MVSRTVLKLQAESGTQQYPSKRLTNSIFNLMEKKGTRQQGHFFPIETGLNSNVGGETNTSGVLLAQDPRILFFDKTTTKAVPLQFSVVRKRTWPDASPFTHTHTRLRRPPLGHCVFPQGGVRAGPFPFRGRSCVVFPPEPQASPPWHPHPTDDHDDDDDDDDVGAGRSRREHVSRCFLCFKIKVSEPNRVHAMKMAFWPIFQKANIA